MPEKGSAAHDFFQPDQVFVIEIKDDEALSAAIEALKDVIPGFDDNDRNGLFRGRDD